ncbi:MAG: hemolysin family protein [Gemmataceae bacterium]
MPPATFAVLPALLAADPPAGDPVKTAIGLVAIPILVGINGFFVAAEFALVAVRRTRVEELVNTGKAGAAALMAAVSDLDRSVAACQLGITVASLALGFVSEPAIHEALHPVFAALPGGDTGLLTRVVSISVTLGLITYLHVVFGEQMPKLAALQSSERVALMISAPVNWFTRVTSPLITLMNGSSNWFLHRLGYKGSADEGEVHTVDELRLLVEDSEEAGEIDAAEAEMVLNVFALNEKAVGDSMVPWEKVVGLELNSPPDRVMEQARLGAHTRLPVYEGSKDNVVGIVNTKDLFFLFSTHGAVLLEDALYPATFLAPDESIANAFKLFQKSHRPMAVVRDEAGKVLGLITMEDVLEEIVGELEDEHDVPVPKLKRVRRRPGTRPSASAPRPKPDRPPPG